MPNGGACGFLPDAFAWRIVAASLVLGLVPLFYFFPPGEVWSLLRRDESSQFSSFMIRLYAVSAGAVFVDIALVRYFLCNYICLYRIGLLLLGSRGTMTVAYDATRADQCSRCNYCRVSCVTGIDPTRIARFDRCINCAECVDACNRLQARRGRSAPGLLRLEWAARIDPGPSRTWPDRIAAMIGWHGLLCMAGCALLAFGLGHLPH